MRGLARGESAEGRSPARRGKVGQGRMPRPALVRFRRRTPAAPRSARRGAREGRVDGASGDDRGWMPSRSAFARSIRGDGGQLAPVDGGRSSHRHGAGPLSHPRACGVTSTSETASEDALSAPHCVRDAFSTRQRRVGRSWCGVAFASRDDAGPLLHRKRREGMLFRPRTEREVHFRPRTALSDARGAGSLSHPAMMRGHFRTGNGVRGRFFGPALRGRCAFGPARLCRTLAVRVAFASCEDAGSLLHRKRRERMLFRPRTPRRNGPGTTDAGSRQIAAATSSSVCARPAAESRGSASYAPATGESMTSSTP